MSNPDAPPKADVADIVDGQAAPALWNANAAASWSLLFSPAFGAFVHMKNWQALGEPAKASTAKTWGIATLLVLVVVSVASGWIKPLLLAVGALICFVAAMVVIGLAIGALRGEV